MVSLGRVKKAKTGEGVEGRKVERASSGQSFISRLASKGSGKARGRSASGVAMPRTNSELAELERAFRVFDANGDGRICAAELGAVLRSLGDSVSEGELRRIMDEADTNRDGAICMEEFLAVNRGGADSLRAAFVTFDKDGNDLISADELCAVLHSLGDRAHSLEDCRRMISQVDQNGDGFVDFAEFESLLSAPS